MNISALLQLASGVAEIAQQLLQQALMVTPGLSCSASVRLAFALLCKMSQQQLEVLPYNLVHSCPPEDEL